MDAMDISPDPPRQSAPPRNLVLLPPDMWTLAYLGLPGVLDIATRRNPQRVAELVSSPPVPQAPQPAVAAAPPPIPAHRSRIPDPVAYDGSVEKLYPFIRSFTNKVRIDSGLFDSAEAAIGYGFSCLSPAVQDRLSAEFAFLEDPSLPTPVRSIEQFVQLLVRHFDDPGRRAKADRQLFALHQGNRTFTVFFAEWSQALRHSSHAAESDNSRKAILRNALNAELSRVFITAEVPDTFDEFVEVCRRYDARIQQENANHRPTYRSAPPSAPAWKTPAPAAATAALRAPSYPRPVPQPGSLRPSLTTAQGGDAMDLDAASKERGSDGRLTPRAREARMKLNRCLRCNQPGHIASRCPLGDTARYRADGSGPSLAPPAFALSPSVLPASNPGSGEPEAGKD